MKIFNKQFAEMIFIDQLVGERVQHLFARRSYIIYEEDHMHIAYNRRRRSYTIYEN